MRGSTIALLGRHGNTEASYKYDAYGVVYGRGAAERHIEAIPGRPSAFKRGTDYPYTGKRQDAATGLYDYGFRDYAPRLARFTSVDPIKDGRNWYAYVGADPVNLVEPLGLASADDGEANGYGAIVPIFVFGEPRWPPPPPPPMSSARRAYSVIRGPSGVVFTVAVVAVVAPPAVPTTPWGAARAVPVIVALAGFGLTQSAQLVNSAITGEEHRIEWKALADALKPLVFVAVEEAR